MILRPGIEIRDDTLAALCHQHHVRRLEAFGSVLRDDFSEESDVDLLVEFEAAAEIGFLALGALKRELETLLPPTHTVSQATPPSDNIEALRALGYIK